MKNSVMNYFITKRPRIAGFFSKRYQICKNERFGYVEVGIEIIAIILVVLFLISLGANFLSTFPLRLDLSNDGFSFFFNKFSSTIKLGAAVIALFTILITIERMRQTERQTNLLGDNNRFNNFYKHRDRFFEFCENNIYFNEKLVGTNKMAFLNSLYGLYYSGSYNDFTGKYNDDFLKRAEYFMILVELFSYLDFSKKLYVERILNLLKYYTPPAKEFVKKRNRDNIFSPFNLSDEEKEIHKKKVIIADIFDTITESITILNELKKFENIELQSDLWELKSKYREIESKFLERHDEINIEELEN